MACHCRDHWTDEIGPHVVATIGFVLLVMSFLTSVLFPVEKAWTPEKSQAMRQVSNDARDISVRIAAAEGGKSSLKGEALESLKQQRDLLEEKRASMQAEFEKASNSSNKMASWLRWSGILAAIGGLGVHRAVNGE